MAPILNEITRNTVEHCGRIRYYGGGVHLDSRPFSMTMEPGNYIAHNHFNDFVGTAADPSAAIYTLPIPEDGTYEISLLYHPHNNRASNVPITIAHAAGTAEVTWNMKRGSPRGFAVNIGKCEHRQMEI